jgi:DNA-binding CsgD family transcriptional regulator
MNASTALERGRTAYSAHRWGDAVDAYTDAEHSESPTAGDLEHLATAAILLGRHELGIDALTHAHESFLADGDTVGAARCAAWMGMNLMNLGEMARSAGWFARAQRLLQPDAEAGSAGGFELIPEALRALYSGDAERAVECFDRAATFAERLGNPDLIALSHLGHGQADIMLGQAERGLLLLDEVMVAVTAGELSPIPSGIIYCAVLQCCRLTFDVRRAREWTRALDHWCADQPDMVAFTGQCQSHRSALFILNGEWTDALAAAESARERSARGDFQGEFGAWYHQGEVQRLRGELEAAEQSYLRAGRTGFEPQPGLALLRLAQGRTKLAQSLIRGAIDRATPDERRWLLAAAVEIELSAGDPAAARRLADELRALSLASSMPMLRAIADQAEGGVLLAEGDARGALALARRAWTVWRELEAPYEAARCRVLTARACRQLGDAEGASMELDAARAVFLELGAQQDLSARAILEASGPSPMAGGLTSREVEVLRLVAAGKTNRMIAAELYLSEKTVARHLSNMFAKLGVSSRAAATAFAYEHGLAT